MKIGIITFHSAHNYGAVLQCWSLQHYLEKLGHEVDVINFRLSAIDNAYKIAKVEDVVKFHVHKIDRVYNIIRKSVKIEKAKLHNKKKYGQYKKFEKFIHHKLHITKKYRSVEELKQDKLIYDAFIAGSDQIWNAGLTQGINPAFLLQFGQPKTIRISYAASIGKTQLSDAYQVYFQRYLRDFDYISVREESAKNIFDSLTARDVVEVADPTFLLEKKDFEALETTTNKYGKYIYVHNVHIDIIDQRLNAVAERLSAKLELPIVHNKEHYQLKNQIGVFEGGIEEFLGIIHNAEYVVTNSFHATVFSIIYNKNFITVPHKSNPERMNHLLKKLGLDNHLIDAADRIPEDLAKLSIDYDKVKILKKEMEDTSKQFLQKALTEGKQEYSLNYLQFADKFNCYGCQACKAACPVGAIHMEADKDGFTYPVINQDLCIHCKKCENVCIYHNEKIKNQKQSDYPLVYAAYNKDSEVIAQSSSGGAFEAICGIAKSRDAMVVGVTYDENNQVVYQMVEAKDAWERFRGSKYVFANIQDIMEKAKKVLEAGREVWFQGTPCQIAGFKSYLGKNYNKLYTIDIICHGTGSPRIFRKYCDELEQRYQSKIVDYKFREQFKGKDLSNQFIKVTFASGSMELERSRKNDYQRAYAASLINRPSCYVCEFASDRYGAADITIGDYWEVKRQHPEFDHEMGVSLVKANNEHGKEILEQMKSNMCMLESTYDKAYKKNHRKPIHLTVKACRYMIDSETASMSELMKRFGQKKGDQDSEEE